MSEIQAETPENQGNSSSELGLVLELLSTDQIRFVVARQECATDKEAAEAIGIAPNTVSYWKRNGAPVDEAVRLMALDGLETARVVLRRALAKAALVKAAGLDSNDERVAQAAATEIIDRALGKATQPVENTHSGELVVRVIGGFANTPPDAT